MILLIDNYDSFTYNLKDYFEQLGEACIVVRNDEKTINEIKTLNFDKIVLSPGPEKPENAGILNIVIQEFHKQYPILGICLGHQALGEFFGAKLIKAAYPMHGKVSEIEHNGQEIFSNIPTLLKVCRYHSLLLSEIKDIPLEVIAKTQKGEVMAIKHNKYALWGVQFHPEAILSECGLIILKNWLETIAVKSVGI